MSAADNRQNNPINGRTAALSTIFKTAGRQALFNVWPKTHMPLYNKALPTIWIFEDRPLAVSS
jgi:hypothetical protein